MVKKLVISKRSLLKTTQSQFKMTEQQENIIKQHEVTYRHAKSGGNLTAVGPWTRSSFPLFKLEERDKEFFIRIDKWTVNRFYLDENKQKITQYLFYPSDRAIKEMDDLKKTGDNVSGYIPLYNKLIEDGKGSCSVTIRQNRKKILKRIEKATKRAKLQKIEKTPSKRIPLKRKAKKLKLRKLK